jgi:hypothetical protein
MGVNSCTAQIPVLDEPGLSTNWPDPLRIISANHEHYTYFFLSKKEGFVSKSYRDVLLRTYEARIVSDTLFIPNGTTIEYDSLGHILRIYQMREGNREGRFVEYYDNGNIHILCAYSNNTLNGTYSSYHRSGYADEVGSYISGCKTGDWVYYYDNGRIKERGNYSIVELNDTNMSNYVEFVDAWVDDRCVPLRNGDWVSYPPRGGQPQIRHYVKGKESLR